ncbi:DNA gyrase inhibitor YacG [Polyangium aurulentum]|uniref:DNA gyrase inhibitor YacG n=1 Tax=Polyangium aurulentum TaxID=2567896 RepID=UPI0010ADC34C|nr:DNA gyrase inhibitor YacG [Polyangium aurulentum]UQA60006.1 DNA gyrase inhibitor YacG [Polyangium aurulentum]
MGAPSRFRCPICARESGRRPENRAFPFCSPQCKLVDLDRWLEGSYRVAGDPVEPSSMMEPEALRGEEYPRRSDKPKGDE